jgi:hypothetical protein
MLIIVLWSYLLQRWSIYSIACDATDTRNFVRVEGNNFDDDVTDSRTTSTTVLGETK